MNVRAKTKTVGNWILDNVRKYEKKPKKEKKVEKRC